MIERYTRPVMAKLWSQENRFQAYLEVELLACEAWAELGKIPQADVAALRARTFEVDRAFVERVSEIEAVTRHDVVAFTQAMAERMAIPEGRWIHFGLTSNDVVDTALSYLMVQATDQISGAVDKLVDLLAKRAVEFKDTVMMGRTHGIHAEPTTFGLKLALWYAEMKRNQERLAFARKNVAVGKLSGAVGTLANIDPFVEQYVCEKLGLQYSPISTQVLQRDRHAELLTTLAIVGGTLEKMALEVRLLQKTESREVEEPFSKGQKGSSAMPHKRNPVTAEQICGLSRVLRGNAMAALEDQALWHERDISHSSVERIILPDSTSLVDYMLGKMTWIIENMHVYPQNMIRSMEMTGGIIFSQRVMLGLVDKGLSREDAYQIVQSKAMEAWDTGVPYRELIARTPEVTSQLTPAELADCFDYRHHLIHVDTIFRRLGLIE